jgi:23S rRNA U2552 (ribose-2'-O)-methylase RlmE/FtsJ
MNNGHPIKPPWLFPQWQNRIINPIPEKISYGQWKHAQPEDIQHAKTRISFLESKNRWELVKKMVNPYEMVYTHDTNHFHPSIAIIRPLSRSYFKMIEMLDVLRFYESLPKQCPKIRTAHVAEGPGGFIQAITDTVLRNKKILQNATAMTLKPTDAHVPGWRRASHFLHHHREVRLHYGADGTGNVYDIRNQNSFIEEAAPGVHLFTADGGFDFSIDYDIQEQRVYHLLVCSATIGMRCLHIGGSFVLKFFDIFSESTMALIGILGRCFKKWTLYKPTLSRPCNSERYFLGNDFVGLSPNILNLLLEIQQKHEEGLYPLENIWFGEKEYEYILEHVEYIRKEQIRAITLAESYANDPTTWYTHQMNNDFKISLAWCQRYHIPSAMLQPMKIHPVVYTSELNASPQLPLLDDGLDSHCPSVPTLSTLHEVSKDHNQAPSVSQIDEDNREQTLVEVP